MRVRARRRPGRPRVTRCSHLQSKYDTAAVGDGRYGRDGTQVGGEGEGRGGGRGAQRGWPPPLRAPWNGPLAGRLTGLSGERCRRGGGAGVRGAGADAGGAT